ncbi:MAG: 3'-5' exonuclease [Deltaproteobacteria bacterium]|jgi:predicted PolB exonuclease-like 3'-5' exonuclease|nr:3'-5' exonuclease [Deltaproteobacteria bacterium]
MLTQYAIKNILFFDIETVPCCSNFSELSPEMQKFWELKAEWLATDAEDNAEKIYERAGIYAEFGKVVCISAGCFKQQDSELNLFLKSFYGDDEKLILQEFKQTLEKFFGADLKSPEKNWQNLKTLCGHNIKEFDVPYLARRMLINGISLPAVLDISGKKPWETQFLDTLELWKFGDRKNYTSLNLLTHLFNIPSSKDDIDGSQVASVYYNEKNLERIAEYCEKDVVAVVRLFQKLCSESLVEEENIIRV